MTKKKNGVDPRSASRGRLPDTYKGGKTSNLKTNKNHNFFSSSQVKRNVPLNKEAAELALMVAALHASAPKL